ncbi:hypothetical protein RJ641_012162 [Dillenia turbinata]|uniref:Uncharacterized protein n=1 Tax=Dillenia turbinata TaxID=194707 RepID=A0AAN8UTC6_9MAGN
MKILPNPAYQTKVPDLKKRAISMRAVYEGILKEEFGFAFRPPQAQTIHPLAYKTVPSQMRTWLSSSFVLMLDANA